MTLLRVWGPRATNVEVKLGERRFGMRRLTDGWWSADIAEAVPGHDYAFVLDDSPPLPDPRSPWQPHGVHGPSRVVDHDAFS